MNQSGLVIGVLAANEDHRDELRSMVKDVGYTVSAAYSIAEFPNKRLPVVDAWVVSIGGADERSESILERLEASGRPILFSESADLEYASAPSTDAGEASSSDLRERHARRLADKLLQLVCSHWRDKDEVLPERAQKVWVIGASTGGPEAVAKFLDGLPDGIPGLAILYAQHIEASALPNLALVVRKHCSWRVEYTESAQVLREKTVYILSPNHQVELNDLGVLSPRFEPWGGRFRPSINQVIAKVARVYKQRSGVIVFSGMGDDGAESCEMMHHRGGQVWIQAEETCTIDSMPASVAKRGLVKVRAAPLELAKQFVEFHTSH